MTQQLISPLRRTVMTLCVTFLAGCTYSRSTQQPAQPPLSAEDEALKLKFRGLGGGNSGWIRCLRLLD